LGLFLNGAYKGPKGKPGGSKKGGKDMCIPNANRGTIWERCPFVRKTKRRNPERGKSLNEKTDDLTKAFHSRKGHF